MDFFFKPKGVAVIGASSNRMKGGNSLVRNLKMGFRGGIYPVNPVYGHIEGITCYESILRVPDPVDMAVVFVPAARVPGVVRECAERGIKGVMIQSAGFAEAGKKGESLQRELLEIKRDSGIRIWGPNCMGLVDAIHKQVFSFVSPTIWEDGPIPGRVSLIVQSGMLSAGFLMDIMTHATMGISKACSIGNKIDVDECDMVEYLTADPDTGVIGLYLESIKDGRGFMDLCRRSSKPVVVLRGGKSEKGALAAQSHTASMAGNGSVIRGALSQAGAFEAYDFKQMMDLCRTLAVYPGVGKNSKARVAVLTFSGAAGIVSADFIEQYGLEMAEFSPATRDALRDIFPGWMPASNPVDLWPAVELNGPEKAWYGAFRAVCADPAVDAVFFHVFSGSFVGDPDITPMVETAREAGKPLFGWLLGRKSSSHEILVQALGLGVPLFQEIYRAVECMAAVFSNGRRM